MTASPQPKAFLDFYVGNDVSPVHQDVSDRARHFRRRDSLYRYLGLPPALLRGRTVVEFGPGSGHNALFTASLAPRRYLLVDGNPRGVAETAALLRGEAPAETAIEVVESLFETFDTDERFDLVLAEGLLSFQSDPEGLLHHLSRFVVPGGIMVITTMSPASYLSEILRRLVRDALIAPDAPLPEQLEVLRPVIGPHLEALPGRSRPLDDWLLDNVVQPIPGRLLPIDRAIATLADGFDLYGASPAFVTDLRWYKDVAGEDRGFNERAAEAYFRNVVNLLDCHLDLPPHDGDLGRSVEQCCATVWHEMQAFENRGDAAAFDRAVAAAGNVARQVGPIAPRVAAAIDEVTGRLRRRGGFEDMVAFPRFWGRGQQYLSFIRRS